MNTIKEKIASLAKNYAEKLNQQIKKRCEEMKSDDRSHTLIYKVLGITTEEGELIDIYQNKGRFLYKYAGAFLEDAAKLCFQEKYPNAKSKKIDNTKGKRPKTFEIDCLMENEAMTKNKRS